MLPQDEYFKSLPRKRISAAFLIVRDNRFLALEPVYKKSWEIPGGVVEEGEDPLSCAIRECQEEIGLTPKVDRLLCIDFQAASMPKGDGVHFVFLGQIEDKPIVLDSSEIRTAEFIDLATAEKRMSASMYARVSQAMNAYHQSRVVLCRDGRTIL
jgi:8-oxo-dGTP diphosphatase